MSYKRIAYIFLFVFLHIQHSYSSVKTVIPLIVLSSCIYVGISAAVTLLKEHFVLSWLDYRLFTAYSSLKIDK